MLTDSTRKLLNVFFALVLVSSCDNADSNNKPYALKAAQSSIKEVSEPSLEVISTAEVISLNLSVDEEGVAGTKVLLTSTLSNSSSATIVFLPWGTPFENAITADFLTVKNVANGEKLSYQGIMVKRMAPKLEDYLSLAPSESIESTLDVSRSYNFCADNRYIIEYSGTLYDPEYKPIEIRSNAIEIDLSRSVRGC